MNEWDSDIEFFAWLSRRPVKYNGRGPFATIEPESFDQLELLWRLNERWKYGRNPGIPDRMKKVLP